MSDPWISGVSNLFTREYFVLLHERLADDGVAAIWFQNYRVSSEHLKIGLQTLASVFPEISVWAPHDDPANLILIAGKRRMRLDGEALHRRIASHSDPASLRGAGVRNVFDFLNLLLVQDPDLRAWADGAPLNTDDHPILEYSLPRLLYTEATAGVVERTTDLLGAARYYEPPVVVSDALRPSFYLALARVYAHYAYRADHVRFLLERTLELDPGNEAARRALESPAS